MTRITKLGFCAMLAITLSGCNSYQNWQAPVSNLHNLHQGQYVVKRGDTIRSVAYGLHVTPSELATWNDLHAPFQLYIGQKLALGPQQQVVIASEHVAPRQSAPLQASAKPMPAPKVIHVAAVKTTPKVAPRQVARRQMIHATVPPHHKRHARPTKPHVKAKPAPKPAPKRVAPKVVEPIAKPVVKPKVIAKKVVAPKVVTAKVSNSGWSWPLQGRAQTVSSGLNISAKEGASVLSASAGKVIYTGPDVSGNGKMVIVSHTGGYLSAYGYLSGVSVKQGQSISRGKLLGKVGDYQGRGVLHFEIRQNGSIKNPRLLLPA